MLRWYTLLQRTLRALFTLALLKICAAKILYIGFGLYGLVRVVNLVFSIGFVAPVACLRELWAALFVGQGDFLPSGLLRLKACRRDRSLLDSTRQSRYFDVLNLPWRIGRVSSKLVVATARRERSFWHNWTVAGELAHQQALSLRVALKNFGNLRLLHRLRELLAQWKLWAHRWLLLERRCLAIALALVRMSWSFLLSNSGHQSLTHRALGGLLLLSITALTPCTIYLLHLILANLALLPLVSFLSLGQLSNWL